MTTETRHETGIQWTHVPGYIGATWNPTTGCARVSPGCDHCYAFTLHDQRHVANLHAARAALDPLPRAFPGPEVIAMVRDLIAQGAPLTLPCAPQYDVPFSTVQLLDEKRLTAPLRAKNPRAYFVDSMADLFHDDVPDEFIDRVFAVMALAPRHLFQILTKRPERMREYMRGARSRIVGEEVLGMTLAELGAHPGSRLGEGVVLTGDVVHLRDWPLPNVWLGTSVEDQQRADERIPLLLDTPAVVRFISAEPLLGPIDLGSPNDPRLDRHAWLEGEPGRPGLDWIIVGGESGTRSRRFDLAWARSLLAQGQDAGVPVFIKQLGQHATSEAEGVGPLPLLGLRHHGENSEEWPEDLRVREFPEVQ